MSVNPTNDSGFSWGYFFPYIPGPADSNYPQDSLCYTADGNIYMIVDNTPGAAVWVRYYKTSLTDSSTATAAFVTSLTAGTPVQNNSGFDLLVNMQVAISSCLLATLTMGVGFSSPPSVDPVTETITIGGLAIMSFSAFVPQGAYLLVDSTGTISISAITVQSCAM